jgi:hypothetical protein
MDICVSVIFRQSVFPIGMILELNSIFLFFLLILRSTFPTVRVFLFHLHTVV